MTASAAVAAGYTLAAGPVRAEAIKTDSVGLTAGEARIKVADGEMPGYFARPERGRQSARRPGRDGNFRPARIHQGRHAATGQARRVRRRPGLLFPQGRRPHRDNGHSAAAADREFETGLGVAVGSRQHGRLGKVAGRRYWPARHHRILPRRTNGAGNTPPTVRRAQGRRRVLWLAGRCRPIRPGRRARRRLARRDEGAGARPVRRGRTPASRWRRSRR